MSASVAREKGIEKRAGGDEPRPYDAREPFVILPDEAGVLLSDPGLLQLADELIAVGACMEPELLCGDRLELERVERVEPGWIAVFEWQGRLYAHRVTRVRGRRFWASGDSHRGEQGPVDMAALRGRVVAVRRDGERQRIASGLAGRIRGGPIKELRMLVQRHASLRRLAEKILGSPVIQIGLRACLGGVRIQAERDPDRLLAMATSAGFRLSEDRVREGQIRACSACARRASRLGWIVGCEIEPDAIAARLFVRPLARGLGLQPQLVSRLEEVAQHAGRGYLLLASPTPGYRPLREAERRKWQGLDGEGWTVREMTR
ncbi:MAG: S24/S26 family peptidase [Deltaproteobacteria bacterium]|nr:S24/S26 family peptidase [Deltaproteobacteria bacterium]